MSYNKTIWTAGDVITAEKLNNIEDGIEAASGGGVIGVPLNFTDNVGDTFVDFGVCWYNIIDGKAVYNSDSVPDYIIPTIENGEYVCAIRIDSESDVLNVTVNGQVLNFSPPVPHAAPGGYMYYYSNSEYPQPITIVITAKA